VLSREHSALIMIIISASVPHSGLRATTSAQGLVLVCYPLLSMRIFEGIGYFFPGRANSGRKTIIATLRLEIMFVVYYSNKIY